MERGKGLPTFGVPPGRSSGPEPTEGAKADGASPDTVTMMPRLQLELLDRVIPPLLRAGAPEPLRRARLLVGFAGILSAMALASIPIQLAHGRYGLSALCLAAAALDASALAVLWRTGSPQAAGAWLGGAASVCLGLFAGVLGGVHGTTLYWFPLVVVVGTMLGGRRGGKAVLAPAVLAIALLTGLDLAGYTLPNVAGPPDGVGQAASALTLTLGFYFLIAAFETTNSRMRAAVQTTNAEMRLVFDNVGQGLLAVDARGRLVGGHSAVAEAWFGRPVAGATLWAYLGAEDVRYRTWLELGWDALEDGVLPPELAVDQLPRRFEHGGRTYTVRYNPVSGGEDLPAAVVVVTDITDLVGQERSEAALRDLLTALDRLIADRTGFRQFMDGTQRALDHLVVGAEDAARTLHTLKGNSGLVGLHAFAGLAHAVEEALADDCRPLVVADLDALRAHWATLTARLGPLLQERQVVELDPARLAELRGAAARRVSYAELERGIAALSFEPASRSLRRAAEGAVALATRLGKAGLRVEVVGDDVLLDPAAWSGVWSTFGHLVRNAVDHGIEVDRAAAGKAPGGALQLVARQEGDALVLEVSDDGAGVNWPQVAARAKSRGLPAPTRADLVDVLFADGFTTRDVATEVSGRGVGLAAFRHAVEAQGGVVEVHSEPGSGTTIRARFPTATSPVSTWRLAG